MCSDGVASASTRTTPLSTVEVCESLADVGTIPGQSMRYMRFVSVMYCQTLVSPGTGATLQTLPALRVLMTEDLPTLG